MLCESRLIFRQHRGASLSLRCSCRVVRGGGLRVPADLGADAGLVLPDKNGAADALCAPAWSCFVRLIGGLAPAVPSFAREGSAHRAGGLSKEIRRRRFATPASKPQHRVFGELPPGAAVDVMRPENSAVTFTAGFLCTAVATAGSRDLGGGRSNARQGTVVVTSVGGGGAGSQSERWGCVSCNPFPVERRDAEANRAGTPQ